MKPQSHTPTPWQTNYDQEWSSVQVIAGEETVADCFPETFGVAEAEEAKANAAFIVRAVNFNQVLLSIAKNLEYKRHGKPDPTCEVCQTIAKAEGK